jgi:hypothetical protein
MQIFRWNPGDEIGDCQYQLVNALLLGLSAGDRLCVTLL